MLSVVVHARQRRQASSTQSADAFRESNRRSRRCLVPSPSLAVEVIVERPPPADLRTSFRNLEGLE